VITWIRQGRTDSSSLASRGHDALALPPFHDRRGEKKASTFRASWNVTTSSTTNSSAALDSGWPHNAPAPQPSTTWPTNAFWCLRFLGCRHLRCSDQGWRQPPSPDNRTGWPLRRKPIDYRSAFVVTPW